MINAFNESEIAWSKLAGANTVKASALLRQQGGGVVTCAGGGITLIPAGAYADERIRRIYGNTSKAFWDPPLIDPNPRVPNPEPGYLQAQITRTCDPQGFAIFSGLADGDYYATAQIYWSMPGQLTSEGGYLMQRVSVRGGETKDVVLSQ
jgi:hypothetical protein